MIRKRITLKDIAIETGFSVMTVSQIINGHKSTHASPENRKRILDVARRLNYQPNLNARRLVTKRTDSIGVLIDVLAPQFCWETLEILTALAKDSGYRLQVGIHHDSFETTVEHIHDFHGSGITTVICMAHTYPEFGAKIPALLDGFEHVIFMERPLAPSRFPYVAADHYTNFHSMATTMLKNGYRRIIVPRDDYKDTAYYESRRGLQDAFRESGVTFEETFWPTFLGIETCNSDIIENALEEILKYNPDVIVTLNDETAMEILKLLKKRNIRVPEEVAVFSSNYTRYCALTSPTISGIDYEPRELARTLFAMLFREPGEGASQCLLPSRLCWLESCPDRKR